MKVIKLVICAALLCSFLAVSGCGNNMLVPKNQTGKLTPTTSSQNQDSSNNNNSTSNSSQDQNNTDTQNKQSSANDAGNNNSQGGKNVVDLRQIVGKSPTEVEKILGKPDAGLKAYPPDGQWKSAAGKKFTAQKASYKKGLVEAVFIEGKLARMNINPKPALSLNASSLANIGLDTSQKPLITNKQEAVWRNLDSVYEVALYPTFVHVISSEKYK